MSSPSKYSFIVIHTVSLILFCIISRYLCWLHPHSQVLRPEFFITSLGPRRRRKISLSWIVSQWHFILTGCSGRWFIANWCLAISVLSSCHLLQIALEGEGVGRLFTQSLIHTPYWTYRALKFHSPKRKSQCGMLRLHRDRYCLLFIRLENCN